MMRVALLPISLHTRVTLLWIAGRDGFRLSLAPPGAGSVILACGHGRGADRLWLLAVKGHRCATVAAWAVVVAPQPAVFLDRV